MKNNYKCNFCGKSFVHQQSKFINQESICKQRPISNEKFKCDICLKEFKMLKIAKEDQIKVVRNAVFVQRSLIESNT